MNPPQQPEPTRLSALYQYHNAPEVAPAHGLEYDDAVGPASDKYPVLRESPLYDGKFTGNNGRYYGDSNNRPPRIVFGMKVRTFLVVASVMVLIVVGAAVGGAVGGKQLREQHEAQLYANATNIAFSTPSTPAAASRTSAFNAAIPTYKPLDDCPASNDTDYTSRYADGDSTADNAGLSFTKYCDLESPFQARDTPLAEAFVYSFSDCVEVCAAYNHLHSASNCTVAVYRPTGERPGNCWVGNAGELQIFTLNTTQGTNVAVLQQ